ncbi:MAG: hypothetical protein Fur006_66900 [Coleofasciculaceae cyanobacterium]
MYLTSLRNAINKILLDPDKRKFLHPEVQAEIEFGIDESKGIEESAFLDNLRILIEHKEDWNVADEDIVSRRDLLQKDKLPAMEKLMAAVPHEVKYQYALWNSNFEAAVDECRAVLTSLNGDDVRGYRAFWNYLAGSAAWIAAQNGITSMESVARDNFKRAASAAELLAWLSGLSQLVLEDNGSSQANTRLVAVIEGLATQLGILGTANNRKFESEVKFILENLNKIRQAASHPNWIKQNVQLLTNVEIIPVMVTPCKKIESGAVPHTQDVSYWNREEFKNWATHAISVVRDLRRSFPG